MADEKSAAPEGKIETLEGEPCPFCHTKGLTLTDIERDIPYFGKVYIYSMNCVNCKFHKADVEAAEQKEPCTITFTMDKEEDLSVRVVKSAAASVKLGRIMTMESTELSNGFVTNIEGLFVRARKVLEEIRDNSEDENEKTQSKKHLKKLLDVQWGREPMLITIEDPTGNSAIISERSEIKPLKVKKAKAK